VVKGPTMYSIPGKCQDRISERKELSSCETNVRLNLRKNWPFETQCLKGKNSSRGSFQLVVRCQSHERPCKTINRGFNGGFAAKQPSRRLTVKMPGGRKGNEKGGKGIIRHNYAHVPQREREPGTRRGNRKGEKKKIRQKIRRIDEVPCGGGRGVPQRKLMGCRVA